MFKSGIINVALRSITLGSKFVLVFFVAKFFSTDVLGIFGLITTSITLSLYVLGLDFYTFNTREILASNPEEYVFLIRDQFIFHFIIYILVLPITTLLFIYNFIPWAYMPYFYALLILEHLCQEFSRLFITLSKPIVSNIILFFRSGLWVYPVLAITIIFSSMKDLKIVLLGWIIGTVTCIVLSVYFLRNLKWRESVSRPIDWNWIRKGIRCCLPFFIATLSTLGIDYVGRYFIQYYYGSDLVGVYTFYSNIANVVQTFVFTGVISILYPELVKSYQKAQYDEYKINMRKMIKGAIGSGILLAVLSICSINTIIQLINKPIFLQYLGSFFVLISAVLLNIASQMPHYGLYVGRCDKYIIYSSVVAFLVVLVGNLLFVRDYGLIGTAFSTFMGMLTLLVLKLWFHNNVMIKQCGLSLLKYYGISINWR